MNNSFLFSFFLFKVPAILNQQTVLNTNVSLPSFFFSFFLLPYFSFKLSALLSQVGRVKHKCPSFFFSFFSFLFFILFPTFGKGRRKNSFKLYLSLLKGLLRRFLSFTGEQHFSRTWRKALLSSVQRFCSTFSPEFWLINQHVRKLKILFQIFSDERVLLSALKASAIHLASFFLISISPGHATQWPTFSSLSN